MSKLGDILKELFPLREMGNQVFGQNRVDNFSRFGHELINQIRSTSSQTIHSVLQNSQRILNDPNRRQHFQQAAQDTGVLFRQIGSSLSRGFTTVGSTILRSLGIGRGNQPIQTSPTGPIAQTGTNTQSRGEIQQRQTDSASKLTRVFSALNRTLDSTINFFLKLAGLQYIVRSLTDRFTASNRELANWNGAIAASFNRLDLERMKLDVRQGAATSGTASELNRQFTELLREFQPVREGIGNIVNIVGINLVQLSRTVLECLKGIQDIFPGVKEVVKGIEDMNKEMKKNNKDAALGNEALSNLTRVGGNFPNLQLPQRAPNNGFLRRHKERKHK